MEPLARGGNVKKEKVKKRESEEKRKVKAA
jgi:hypothetical protein